MRKPGAREKMTQPLTTWVTSGPREDKPRHRWGRTREMGGRLSVSSVRSYVKVWKVFFNWCFQEELVDKSPVARLFLPLPEKKVQPVVTVEQMERMLATCDRSISEGVSRLCDLGSVL